jgi:hypothetical protein
VSNKITRQFGFGFGSRPSKSTGDRTMLQEVEADLKEVVQGLVDVTGR